MNKVGETSLLSLIPPNLRSDEKVRAAALAIDKQLKAISDLIPRLIIFDNLNSLSEEWLDELAWEYHVDFYDQSLPIEQKRELIWYSMKWHQQKGTPVAIEELITTVFGSGEVVEWWEYEGEPYKFKARTNDPTATNQRAEEFIRALNAAKNERSWLDSIEITMNEQLPMNFAGILHMGESMTVRQVV